MSDEYIELACAGEHDTLLEDAEQYRWWKENRQTTLIVAMFGNGCINKTIEDVEAAVLADLRRQKGKGAT